MINLVILFHNPHISSCIILFEALTFYAESVELKNYNNMRDFNKTSHSQHVTLQKQMQI